MSDRNCSPAWELLSPTGWVGGESVDVDYTSGIDKRHEKKAELFRGIPPREFDAGYFVFVDSYSSMARINCKIHLVEEVSRIRQIEHWPKRLNGQLYVENMIDMTMAEFTDPRIRKIETWYESIADVSRGEWERKYATKYERIWRLLSDWAWAADEKVCRNVKLYEKRCA